MGSLIPEGASILLDTVIYIYFLEDDGARGEQAMALFRRIESGDITALASNLVFTELLVPLYRDKQVSEANRLSTLLANFPNMEFLPIDKTIAISAARLRARYQLRTPDALHAATAISAGVDGMLTNDRQLERLQSEGLKIWQFDELMEV